MCVWAHSLEGDSRGCLGRLLCCCDETQECVYGRIALRVIRMIVCVVDYICDILISESAKSA